MKGEIFMKGEYMNKVIDFFNKYIMYGLLLIIFLESIFIIYIVFFNKIEEVKEIDNSVVSVLQKQEVNEGNLSYVKVDIKGAVKNPGVYELSDNSIINDVIKKSGGLLKGASTKNINLSKKIENEMVIYIAYKNEFREVTCKDNQTREIKEESENVSISSKSALVSNYNNIDANNNLLDSESSNESILININSATKEELLKIPSIGSSKADLIIAYRLSKGKFNTIEDIKNVSGIGDNLFEKIKNYITV